MFTKNKKQGHFKQNPSLQGGCSLFFNSDVNGYQEGQQYSCAHLI
jgi:hypothetical protein